MFVLERDIYVIGFTYPVVPRGEWFQYQTLSGNNDFLMKNLSQEKSEKTTQN